MIGCDCATCRSQRSARSPPAHLGTRSPLMTTAVCSSTLGPICARRRWRTTSGASTPSSSRTATPITSSGWTRSGSYNILQRRPMACYGDDHTLTTSAGRSPTPSSPRASRRVAASRRSSCSPSSDRSASAGRKCSRCRLIHGTRPILGYRLGRFAYLTDCSAIPDESWPLLEDLDVLVLDALRVTPHPTHFSLSEAIDGDAPDRAAPRLLHAHVPRSARTPTTSARPAAGDGAGL